MSPIRVANAPCSYGAFEITVGRLPNVPEALDVLESMAEAGYEIVPVPVYYPDVTEILGEPVYRTLAEIPEPVDMVNVFRRSRDIPPHLSDILAAKPKSVWLQLGIRNDEVAETLARAGIKVVQDR